MSRNGDRQGQSTLISMAVYTAIVVVALTVIITAAQPTFERLRDAKAIDHANEMLSELGNVVQSVASGGEGSRIETSLRFSQGEFVFDASEDSIFYQIDTRTQLISPHTSKQIGNLRMSALATVDVTRTEIDGQDCWQMENDHVSVCIRAVPQFAEDAIDGSTVGFWRFSTGSGQVAADNSSYGNDGTLGSTASSDTNDPAWTGGQVTGGLTFDGNDHINAGSGNALDVGGEEHITIGFWANITTSASDANKAVFKTSAFNVQPQFETGDRMRVEIHTESGGWQSCTTPTGFTALDTWAHYATTWNGSHVRIYKNGRLNTTCSVSGHFDPAGDSEDLCIGAAFCPGPNGHVTGQLDEVRIWNRTLTTEEIRWQARSDGMLDYMDTRNLILNYHSKDADKDLSADYSVDIDTRFKSGFTMNGTGYTAPDLTGDNLGRGRVVARMKSFFGLDYIIEFQLLSGADFLQINLINN